MKQFKYFLMLFLVSIATFGKTFSNYPQPGLDPPDEFTTLATFLEGKLNFIKGDFPIITADEVKKNLKNEAYHIVDIRTAGWFEYGHIKNAANVPAEDLLAYFETKMDPSKYERIVVVCYSGQSAAYYAGLLRIAGYDNVYSMKWGMSTWREDFAEPWLKNTGASLEDKLQATPNEKPLAGTPPELHTGKTESEEILHDRLQELFAVPYKEFILKPADVFEQPESYFTIYYGKADDYNKGHMPGAVFFEEGNSLLLNSDLLSLPKTKKVAIYTTTGQRAAYLTAYLNVLGYDAGNIAYGENGFMHGRLEKEGRDAFTPKEINLYPVIE